MPRLNSTNNDCYKQKVKSSTETVTDGGAIFEPRLSLIHHLHCLPL